MKKIVLPILVCVALFMSGCSLGGAQRVNATTQNKPLTNQIKAEINNAANDEENSLITSLLDTTVGTINIDKPSTITFKFNQLTDNPADNIVAKAKIRSDAKYLNSIGYDNLDGTVKSFSQIRVQSYGRK